MKSCAPWPRAKRTRSFNGTKVSSARVIATRYLPVLSSFSRSMVANRSTRSFSCSPLGAWVPLSMPPWPGSSDDHRPGIAGALAASSRAPAARAAFGRRLSIAAARRKVSRSTGARSTHEAGRLALGGIDHEGAGDPHRSGDVDDDARAALHDEAEAERLDDAAAVLAGLRRELEIDLGDIDHHAIGIGDGEGAHIDLAGEVDDEPGLLVVTGEAGLARDRKRLVRRGGDRHRHLGAGRNRAQQREAGTNGGQQPQQYASPRLTTTSPAIPLWSFVLL